MERNPQLPQFSIAKADCTRQGPLTQGDPMHKKVTNLCFLPERPIVGKSK